MKIITLSLTLAALTSAAMACGNGECDPTPEPKPEPEPRAEREANGNEDRQCDRWYIRTRPDWCNDTRVGGSIEGEITDQTYHGGKLGE